LISAKSKWLSQNIDDIMRLRSQVSMQALLFISLIALSNAEIKKGHYGV